MKSPSRWISVGLALAAAFALSLAVGGTGWWTAGEVSFGPFGAHDCFGGACRATGLAWLGGDDLWMRSAVATRVGGFYAAGSAIMLAGAVAAGRVPRLVAWMLVVAATTALVAGAYFVARCPELEPRNISTGLSLFVGGLACAAGAAALVIRAPRRQA